MTEGISNVLVLTSRSALIIITNIIIISKGSVPEAERLVNEKDVSHNQFFPWSSETQVHNLHQLDWLTNTHFNANNNINSFLMDRVFCMTHTPADCLSAHSRWHKGRVVRTSPPAAVGPPPSGAQAKPPYITASSTSPFLATLPQYNPPSISVTQTRQWKACYANLVLRQVMASCTGRPQKTATVPPRLSNGIL